MANKKKQSSQDSPPQRKTQKRTTNNSHQEQQNNLTVVGIGASAGGLKALQDFFEALPDDTGLAFVVVTHLAPEHESHMAEILQNRTRMRVRQVAGKVDVEPNNVYVIPPGREIFIADSQLDLRSRAGCAPQSIISSAAWQGSIKVPLALFSLAAARMARWGSKPSKKRGGC